MPGASTGAGDAEPSLSGRLRSLFFGSRPRILGTIVLSVVLASGVAVAVGAVGVPAVTDFQNEFAGVNDSTTIVASTIEVSNPNPIGAGFLGVSGEYAISMNDVHLANGSTGDVAMPPGNSTVDLRTYLANDRIPAWWVSHVQRGEQTTVRVKATVESDLLGRSVPVERTRSVETDMLSSFNSTETRAVNSSSVFVDDPMLYINETRAHWGEVSQERTGIVVDMYVYNPKEYAIPVSKLNYTIDMNAVRVGAGENTDENLLTPKEVTRVRTVTYIKNDNLDEWWVTHVERDQVTDVVVDFAATVEVAGTEIAIPLEGATHQETIETDVFGTKDEPTTRETESTDGSNVSDDDSTGTSSPGDESGGDGIDTTTTTEPSGGGDGTTTGGGTTTDDGGILSVEPVGDGLDDRPVASSTAF
jgi:LEA14-like dessication related protein